MVDISGRKETTMATGPVLVRNVQRHMLLEGIQRRISAQAKDFRDDDLYRIFLRLLDKELALSQSGISDNDFTEIPWHDKECMFGLFCEIVRSVKEFQRSRKEGKYLLAKLLEWTASEITRSYHSMLTMQETDEPRLMFDTKHVIDKIPIE